MNSSVVGAHNPHTPPEIRILYPEWVEENKNKGSLGNQSGFLPRSRMTVADPTIATYTFLYSKNTLADGCCNHCSACFPVLTALKLNHGGSHLEDLRSIKGRQQQLQQEALQSFGLLLFGEQDGRNVARSLVKPGKIRTQLQVMDAALREHLRGTRARIRHTQTLAARRNKSAADLIRSGRSSSLLSAGNLHVSSPDESCHPNRLTSAG